jgi:hypothetical protein
LQSCGDGTTITLGQATLRPVVDAQTATPGKDAGPDVSIGACPGCQACPGGSKTTISGTVFDPGGRVPLYNAIVYIPRDAANLDPIPEGLSCDQCAGIRIQAVQAAKLTDASGQFVLDLDFAPSTPTVPLVIQIGKWRRAINVPVVACRDNPITDSDLTRLPRNSREGHLPQIALTTGHSDALECLLRRIGIDDTEFTTDAEPGRVHMFVGCDGGNGLPANQFSTQLGGAKFAEATTLWSDPGKLGRYDMLIFSCEGSQCADEKKRYVGNIKTYADSGGRLFLDHTHFSWLMNGPDPWPNTATFISSSSQDISSLATVDTSFPKGSNFADWLVKTQASSAMGSIPIINGQVSVRSTTSYTQRWIFANNPSNSDQNAIEYMTMNTPAQMMPDANQCGRVVYTGLHVTSSPDTVGTGTDASVGTDLSHSDVPFPLGCVSRPLTPQEKALEFMLFDLASCVQSDAEMPIPPTVR